MNVTIETASGQPAEVTAAAELRRLVSAYDLRGLEWTNHVVVQTGTRPHSHPILTINTRRSGDSLLAVYLHEQLHWWLANHDQAAKGIEATREHWKSTPSSANGGARNEFSTRLHLFVCFLEHRAMQLLTGSERANAEITHQIDDGIYPWIRGEIREQSKALTHLCDRYELWPPRLAGRA